MTPAMLNSMLFSAAENLVQGFGAALLWAAQATGACAAIAGLYMAKSAAGINILPWHSPLHDLLYHFVR
ncbi:MAG: hypothetical protein NW216_03170 [Hyphomicrobium sp.]|nr:hypothetical protein [Hyphomicrobium sp.]